MQNSKRNIKFQLIFFIGFPKSNAFSLSLLFCLWKNRNTTEASLIFISNKFCLATDLFSWIYIFAFDIYCRLLLDEFILWRNWIHKVFYSMYIHLIWLRKEECWSGFGYPWTLFWFTKVDMIANAIYVMNV